jgi:hypothetical protein
LQFRGRDGRVTRRMASTLRQLMGIECSRSTILTLRWTRGTGLTPGEVGPVEIPH